MQIRSIVFVMACISIFSVAMPNNRAVAQSSHTTDENVLFRINVGGAAIGAWDEDSETTESPWLLPGATTIYTKHTILDCVIFDS